MTEVERANKIASGPRRRFLQNVALVVALMLGLAGVALGWHQLSERAVSAETSAVSLAEQVQARCDEQGSLRVGDRELCKQAEKVVEDPTTPVPPPPATQGDRGPRGFTGAQGIQGRTGPPGEQGPRGRPGKDGMDGRDGTDGLDGAPGLNGADGEDGSDGLPGKDGLNGAPGADGAPGKDGLPGKDGAPGAAGKDGTARPGTYTCPDGELVAGFTVAESGAVTLSCQAPAPVIGPPVPTPTPGD